MRLLLAVLLSGCASPNAPVTSDLSALLAPDLSTSHDSGALPDLTMGDGPVGPCTLGDPDHCGTCATICAPGMDTAGTKRTCSMATAFGTCGYQCKGEFYDVDGKSANGCEAEDVPQQDSSATAVAATLPNTALAASPGPGLNPTNLVSQIYGDNADHEMAPVMRVNGRDDWFKLTVTGAGATDRGVGACLGITNYPPDNMYQLCLSAKGATTFLPAGCMMATGGAASVCVKQTNATDGNGVYYVRVSRQSGATYTANQYALYLEH